ncbi:imidazoleglycerol-phosphate dehydratase HisB [Erysipelotrichaceae bacterium AF15-26LB]|nr:imidazoleglycerol-phosphate dehydratase HisB [[Clostridium] innocuum]RJV90048.1 imidazoleglycerol-phosphate dehydratase HisB [Erysipelotrichaceae bacterium AF15-26LB]RJV93327.1 imidazoleglycerol-phosphate dehydratase HisB [Erysipelotrichaceae bacterium AF19-24AC]
MKSNATSRCAKQNRDTKETKVSCYMNLDGDGTSDIHTGIGFFDHMLTLFSFHSGIDLTLSAQGDLEVCDHHTVEDCGILMGACLNEALQDKRGIGRYGSMLLPMDEALAQVVLDISGRSFLVYNCELKRDTIGSFSCEMVEEFLRAFAFQAGITLHVNVPYGTNDHHKVEAIFKALGRALKAAIAVSGDALPSTKGTL